jgi:hypothetical protein
MVESFEMVMASWVYLVSYELDHMAYPIAGLFRYLNRYAGVANKCQVILAGDKP